MPDRKDEAVSSGVSHLQRKTASLPSAVDSEPVRGDTGVGGITYSGDSKPKHLPPPGNSTMLATPPRLRSASKDTSTVGSGDSSVGSKHHSTTSSCHRPPPSSPFSSPAATADESLYANQRPLSASSASAVALNALRSSPAAVTSGGLTASERRRRKTTAMDSWKAIGEEGSSPLVSTPEIRAGIPAGRSVGSSGVSSRRRSRFSEASSPAFNPFQSIIDEPSHTGKVGSASVSPMSEMVCSDTPEGKQCSHGGASTQGPVAHSTRSSLAAPGGLRQSRILMQFQQLDQLANSLQTDADSAVESLSRRLKKNRSNSIPSADDQQAGNGCGVDISTAEHNERDGHRGNEQAHGGTHDVGAGIACDSEVPKGMLQTSSSSVKSRKLVLGTHKKVDSPPDRTGTALADAEKLLAKFDKRLNRTGIEK